MFDKLGLGGGNSVRLDQIFRVSSERFIFQMLQLLGGLSILLGIPFPVYLYYRGEALRAANPLTRDSTLPKHKP